MAGGRIPGSAGLSTQHGAPEPSRPRTVPARPGPNRDWGLGQDEEGLLLDATQLTLDIVGIIEPTPFADGSNALISLARHDYFGAIISGVSIVPYLGDFAKIAKLPKYARSIREAIMIARQDARFAHVLEPVLRKLARLIDEVPLHLLPGRVESTLRAIRADIEGFLHLKAAKGALARAMDRLPGPLRKSFERAMDLPRGRNPRLLKKRPGPVAEDVLIEELEGKGFVRIKEGGHPSAAGKAGGEDSDVWLRRVREEGKDFFEAIRVDRRSVGLPAIAKKQEALAKKGMAGLDKEVNYAREHHSLSETTKDALSAGAHQSIDSKDVVGHISKGGKKGDFSHWHHEMFEATPENLSLYIHPKALSDPEKAVLKGQVRKFDPVGVEIPKQRYK